MVRFYFARATRRHKIGRAHALAAIANAGTPTVIGAQLHWTALDDRGVELHIIGKPAAEDPDLVVLYHVMPTALRKKQS